MKFIQSLATRLISNHFRWGGAALAATAAFCGAAAQAGSYEYGTPQRTINAGIIGDYSYNNNSTIPWPYVFYQLSQSSDARPVGWSFVNPLAARVVNADISSRWGSGNYSVGQALTSEMGPYWEVLLQTTNIQALQSYQVLLLETNGADPGLEAGDVEKLRQFVDGGGVLWIDSDAATNLSSFTGWFSVTSSNSAGNRNAVAGGPVLSPGIPAIASPYDLTLGGNYSYFNTMPGSNGEFGIDSTLFLGEWEGNVGASPTGEMVAVGHLGAGSVIFSNIGAAAETGAATTSGGPMTLTNAQTPVLQFVADVLSRSNDTLTAFHGRQSAGYPGDTFGTSVMPSWRYMLSSSGAVTSSSSTSAQAGAYGRFAYVMNPLDSSLHWFVLQSTNQASTEFPTTAYVPTSLAGSGGSSSGTYFSAPTVWPGYSALDTKATAPYSTGGVNGFTNVFVENQAGSVAWVDTSAKSSVGTCPGPAFYPNGATTSPGGTFASTPPSPTIFEHRLYATQPSGHLYIYDFMAGTSASAGGDYQANPVQSATGEIGQGQPVLGVVHDDCDNLVAAYTTNVGLYTILTGAREELLSEAGFDASGNRMYSTKLTGANPMNPSNPTAVIDANAPWSVYEINANGQKFPVNANIDTTTLQRFSVSSVPTTPPISDPGASELYADYDVDWKLSQYQLTSGQPLTPGSLDRIEAPCAGSSLEASSGATPNSFLAAMMSSPVMDQQGRLYYIDNVSGNNGFDSSVISLRDAYPQSKANMPWRYKLPTTKDYSWFVNNPSSSTTTGLQDAAGHDYSKIGSGLAAGEQYAFVGAPVVDNRGSVYVAAVSTNSTNTSEPQHSAIFRFDPGDQISAALPQQQSAINTTSVRLIQQSGDPNLDEWGEVPGIVPSVDYSANSSGQITFSGFGNLNNNYLYPLLSEGEPINVSYSLTSGAPTNSVPSIPFSTNVAWVADLDESGLNSADLPSFVTTTPIGVIGGLAVEGDYLYFTSATNGHLYRLYTQAGVTAVPQPGTVITSTTPNGGYLDMAGENAQKKQNLQDLGDTGVEPITPLSSGYVPSGSTSNNDYASNGDVSESNGTLIVTGGGGVVNYQPQLTLVTDQTRLLGLDADGDAEFSIDSTTEPQASYAVTNPLNTNTTTTTTVGTHVALNRPTSVTQLSADRYLMADSGNNRCVEIDRNGNVLWELSKFVDSTPLLSNGESTSLDNPTSVQPWRDAANNIHYLIADSGNNRIIDVVDEFQQSTGSVIATHLLDWVSQTGNRDYRFENAFRYNLTAPTAYNQVQTPTYAIAALVTNTRIAPMMPGTPNTLAPTSSDGEGASIVLLDAGFKPSVNIGDPSDPLTASSATSGQIINVLDTFESGGSTSTPFVPHNPRFLGSYTPDPLAMPTPSTYDGHDELLYCDDNGAFDLDPNWPSSTPYANVNWWLGQSTYRTISTPIDANSTSFARGNINFQPTCLIRTGTDVSSSSGTGTPSTTFYGRYLIANPFTQGNVNSNFNPNAAGFGGEVFLYSAQNQTVLTDRTFSRPSNTGPLHQPTSAVLAK